MPTAAQPQTTRPHIQRTSKRPRPLYATPAPWTLQDVKGQLLQMPEGERPPTRKQVDALLARRADIGAVYVTRPFARLFRMLPHDGRAWYIEDPDDATALHCTRPDASSKKRHYECWRDRGQSEAADTQADNPFALPVTVKRQGQPSQKHRKRQLTEVADLDVQVLLRNPELIRDLPAILIPLATVERMTGFKKSFIYAQPGFPQPIKFGTNQRSAVRWNLREVLAWIEQHMAQRGAQRDAAACMESGANVSKKGARQMHQRAAQTSLAQFAVTASATQRH